MSRRRSSGCLLERSLLCSLTFIVHLVSLWFSSCWIYDMVNTCRAVMLWDFIRVLIFFWSFFQFVFFKATYCILGMLIVLSWTVAGPCCVSEWVSVSVLCTCSVVCLCKWLHAVTAAQNRTREWTEGDPNCVLWTCIRFQLNVLVPLWPTVPTVVCTSFPVECGMISIVRSLLGFYNLQIKQTDVWLHVFLSPLDLLPS